MRHTAFALLLTLVPLAAFGQAEKITGLAWHTMQEQAYEFEEYTDGSILARYSVELVVVRTDGGGPALVVVCRLDDPWPPSDSIAASVAVHVDQYMGDPVDCMNADDGAYTFAGWWHDGVFYVLGMEAAPDEATVTGDGKR